MEASINDIKNLWNSSKPYWGIPGYTVPKTLNYLNKSAVISSDRSSRPKTSFLNPDPRKYSPTLKKTQELFWSPRNGKFLTSKKINFIEEQLNRTLNNPGPGLYHKEKNLSQLNTTLGKFDKCEKLSFLTTVESNAEETPSCWDYAAVDKWKGNGLAWIKPKSKGKELKIEVGPGKYSEGMDLALSKTMTTSPKYSFPKSARTLPKKRILTPGVGSYKEAEKASLKFTKARTKAAIIFPYKIKGFTETVMKNSAYIPGPGAYNIGPPTITSK